MKTKQVKAEKETPEVAFQPCEVCYPSDMQAVPEYVYDELLPKKREGNFVDTKWENVSRFVTPRAPKALTMEQVRKHYENNDMIEIGRDVNVKHKTTTLERLIDLCTKIAHSDTNFQNLTSEIPYAEKIAKQNLEYAVEIWQIMETTKPEDASMVLSILRIMNICYMRVLGDRMKYLPLGKTNLEDWIKNACYDNALRAKAYRNDLLITIFENQPKNRKLKTKN